MSERSHDYLAKNMVREAWMRFLPPSFSEYENPAGLYLPAENLELPGYLTKGFRPEMLIGAEHDARRLPSVLTHAGGIRVVSGSVANAVEMIERKRLPRLAFANIDLDGTYQSHRVDLLSIFRVLPVAPCSYLGVTSYAARGRDVIVQGVVNTSKFRSGLQDGSAFFRGYDTMVSRYRDLKRLIRSRVPDHHHLSRELGLLWWFVVALSFTREAKNGYRTLDKRDLNRVEKVLEEITRRAKAVKEQRDLFFVSEPDLRKVLKKCKTRLWPMELRHMIYQTQSAQPMSTWFLKIVLLDSDDEVTAQDVLEQIWNLAVHTPLVFINRSGSLVRFE